MKRIGGKTTLLRPTRLKLTGIHDTSPSDRSPTCFSSLRSCFEEYGGLPNGGESVYLALATRLM
jgi:hypothetical protein